MRVVPRNKGPRLAFFHAHAARWVEQAHAIGLPAEAASEFKAMVDELEAAVRAETMARQLARSATRRVRTLMSAADRRASKVMKRIRGHATTNCPELLQLALLPKPQHRSRIGPPGRPDDFKHALNQVGWLTLRWKCAHPRGAQGTIYRVHRQTDLDPVFRCLGLVGRRRFVDSSIPRGVSSLIYQIQALRSGKEGPIARYSVDLYSTMPVLPAQRDPNAPLGRKTLAA